MKWLFISRVTMIITSIRGLLTQLISTGRCSQFLAGTIRGRLHYSKLWRSTCRTLAFILRHAPARHSGFPATAKGARRRRSTTNRLGAPDTKCRKSAFCSFPPGLDFHMLLPAPPNASI